MTESAVYTVGIDLGTTNSAVACVDSRRIRDPQAPPVRLVPVPQLVAPGEMESHRTLPSFLYFPDDRETASGALRLPWDERPRTIAGVLAREQGALVPARQVSSAKSWLCNPAVDRTSPLLPRGADRPVLSPVEASTRYLDHIREAWNHVFAGRAPALRLERQDVVLTVPASFDEEARELTVQAAREAGIDRMVLLEEPLAAFYAWLAAHRESLARHLRHGEVVLVCDVGGGTTDFSLIRVAVEDETLGFERTATGEHLLLGGDNLDLALAVLVERKLAQAGGMPEPRLSLTQRHALRRQCSAAKERLLSDPGIDRVRIAILGGGRAVVGGALQTELTREEVAGTLTDGFLPLTGPGERPARDRRAGLRELGLPYESEPAITRHLAAFLTRAARGAGRDDPMIRPDAILFNGGFFTPAVARDRIVDAVAGWFRGGHDAPAWRPRVLVNRSPETAVAMGAAYYGSLRRAPAAARRLLVRAGSARAYYIGLHERSRPGAGVPAICILPRGTEEGTRLELPGRTFQVMTNQPVAFTLYSSTRRTDAQGAVVALDEDEGHRHAPLITVFRFGRKSRRVELDVRLSAHFTEVGTLELWCESLSTEHRWRLQFQLRQAPAAAPEPPTEPSADGVDAAPAPDVDEAAAGSSHAIVAEAAVEAGARLVRDVFGAGEAAGVETLTARLEALFGYGKHAWPIGPIRRLADALIDAAAGRTRTPRFEARWLNLFGFCLRPGFGAAADPWRIGEARKVYLAGLTFPRDVQCQVEWLVLWQRAAGGFTAGQQRELFQRIAGPLGVGGRKAAKRLNPQIERESWRLLASLERLDAATRTLLGDELLARIRKEPRHPGYLWALGRVGARTPFYGPLNAVVPPEAAGRWIEAVLALRELPAEAASALVQMAAATDDPTRDVDEALRRRAIDRLESAGAGEEALAGLRQALPPARADALRAFGEPLPEGLRLAGG